MAYDPYSAGEYSYYQDQSAGYDPYSYGYDGYGQGYDAYGGYVQETPPPPPDKNWVDPRQLNKAYLDRIKGECVLDGFKGLKEKGLFLLEVFVQCVELNREVIENIDPEDQGEQSVSTLVKFLDLPFMEVNVIDTGEKITKADRMPSFSDLVQTLYTLTGEQHLSLYSKDTTKDEEELNEMDPSLKQLTSNTQQESEEKGSKKECVVFQVKKGKSVLLPKTGLDMIQSLQQQALIVKVAHCGVIEEDKKVEGATLGTSSITVPETFRQSILWSIKPGAILPFLVVETNSYQLLDAQGQLVGEIYLSISLTSFGGSVVNCVRETETEVYDYEHTIVMRSLKPQRIPESLFTVNPRLALEVLQMGSNSVKFKTSKEILENSFALNLIEADDEERRRALMSSDCDWLKMVKDVLPKEDSTTTLDADLLLKAEEENKMAAMWRSHKKICRDLGNKIKDEKKKSIFDRLGEVQIQTGVVEIESNNPFLELARKSQSESRESTNKSKTSNEHTERKSSLKSSRSAKK